MLSFDTHKAHTTLIQSGYTEQQAEGQVRVLSEIVFPGLATKDGLDVLAGVMKTESSLLQAEMRELGARLFVHLGDMELRLTRWWVGAIMAQTAVTITLLIKVLSLGRMPG